MMEGSALQATAPGAADANSARRRQLKVKQHPGMSFSLLLLLVIVPALVLGGACSQSAQSGGVSVSAASSAFDQN